LIIARLLPSHGKVDFPIFQYIQESKESWEE
jgi:hypothetical protein